MANQIRAQQHFRYRDFHINKSQPLGHGSYGAVYKAKCDQLPCAAKVLHPTILDPSDPGAGKIMQRFQQECAFLENIRHPNIVQYLGMTRDPESRLPVLLMELLDESLTKMLEHSQRSLTYYVQVDICHDIALAVAYLHSNDIIHRDLSSNNVLIMAKRRAKVTDFGMSKLAGAAPSMTPLTMCPGTLAYMPPEALKDQPVYTKKLDCFSEGVIMIQVCTRLWPEPGPRFRTVPFPASPTGTTEVPVLELERRKNHIDMIDRGHGLLSIAMDCLHYQENERPSSEELCQRLAGLKETREYRASVEQVERVQNDIAELERQIQQRYQSEIEHLESEIQSKDIQLKRQDEQHQLQIQKLSQQLEEQEQVTAEIQQTNNSLQRTVEQLQKQPSQGGYLNLPLASYGTCSLPGCQSPKYRDPANGRIHDYCGRSHAAHARTLGLQPSNSLIRQANQHDFFQVSQQFTRDWDTTKGTCPQVNYVYVVSNSVLEARWSAYRQSLQDKTVEQYYHGTELICNLSNMPCTNTDCGVCGISNMGLDRRCIRKNINFQIFGHGFYFTPNSSKCHNYTQGANGYRAMLLFEVCPGRKYVLTDHVCLKGPPPGYDCVFMNKGNYAEIIVYNPDAVVPRYIIVYQKDGVHKIAK